MKEKEAEAKGMTKGDQKEARKMPKWKSDLPKYPVRHKGEQIEKKDAKRLPMYARGLPKWS